MIQHFLSKISKLEIKHLKYPGNQKAFKGVPKENIILNGSEKRNKIDAERCTMYKTLFKTLKQKSKTSQYLNLTGKYKNYIKKTQDVMKEIIKKFKFKIKKLPRRIAIDKKKRLFKTL